ncbi:MAG: hypothetical protein ACT4QC_16005 [Planctomycetaceae bacterium]
MLAVAFVVFLISRAHGWLVDTTPRWASLRPRSFIRGALECGEFSPLWDFFGGLTSRAAAELPRRSFLMQNVPPDRVFVSFVGFCDIPVGRPNVSNAESLTGVN